MKKIIFLIFFIALANAVFAQSPNWLWANSAGGTSYDLANSVTTDASGNVISVGDFYGSSVTFGLTTLTSGGDADMFIVKYDAGGNVLWANSAGGNLEDRGLSVSADDSGNIIAVGSFSSATMNFDTITLTNAGVGDIYIVKYNVSGNVLWAKSFGGTSFDGARSITTDHSGNIFVSGSFNSPTITFGSSTLTNTGNFDFYIAKFDPAGNVLWVRSASGNNWDYGSITVDDSGNVIAAGTYLSPTLTFDTTTLINAGGSSWDLFVVKYDAAGNLRWANTAGGTGSDGVSSVTSDASGNVIIAGTFNSASISFDTITLTTPGMFIVKYNAIGKSLWAIFVDGAGATSVTTDGAGNIIAAGSFNNPTITVGTTMFTNADTVNHTADLFIAKYDSSGNLFWANSTGGINTDNVYSLTTDVSGKIIAAGLFYSPTIAFGSTTLINADNTGNTYDLFIAKLDTTTVTGFNETGSLENNVFLFPNPATTHFAIVLENNKNKNEVTITDITGNIIFHITSTDSESYGKQGIEINTNNFADGVYLVKIQSDNFFKTEKLIVNK